MRMKVQTIIILLSVGILLPASVYAVGPPVAHEFFNGTPADADHVNANFQELANRISDIPGGDQAASFGYSGYGSSGVTSKTFTVSGPQGQDFEIRTFERPDANTTIVMQSRQFMGATNRIRRLTYIKSADDVRWTKREDVDPIDGTTLLYTLTMSPGVVVRKNGMKIGQPWSTGTLVHVVDEFDEIGGGAGIDPDYYSVTTDTRTVEAVEDVTVPAGTFQNCLKITNNRAGNLGTHLRVSWYCPNGIGLVKQYHGNFNGTFSGGGRLIELSAYTPVP